MNKTIGIIVASLLLGGCAMKEYGSYDNYMTRRSLPAASKQSFPHCSDYDCATVQLANFWPREWKKVEAVFKPKAKTAAKEREQIATAIMMMERIIGPITGTDGDVGDTFKKTGKGQLDCVDESTNTSVYLDLLRQEGLIKFHTLEAPVARAPMFRWPHQTAVIRDKKTGEFYAVDSWFNDNGEPIYIVPLETWRDGWKPAA